ncbi:MAG: hypothetical protein Q9216_005224, partial [Gyalolechia sp. 2 TL-2023]
MAPSKNMDAHEMNYPSADQPPAPDSLLLPYPMSSNKAIQHGGSGQAFQASGDYSGPRSSYPLYYNTSSTPGPTATYSTAVSPGYPWSNDTSAQKSSGSTSVGCNCPPPSTVTVQNTMTLPPTTVTMFSTITASAQSAPQITPTMTVTITTTVCAGNGKNTGTGGGAPSAMFPKSGGQGPGAEYPIQTGGVGSTFPITSGSGFASNISTSESHPRITGSGGVIQPYQPPFANGTGSSSPSFPVGTDAILPTGTPENPLSNPVQRESTGLPGSKEYIQLPTSKGLDSGTAVVSIPSVAPISSGPAASLEQSLGQAGGNVEQPQTSIQYPGAPMTSPTTLPNGGQYLGNTQGDHNMSITPISDFDGSIEDDYESSSTGVSVAPPYGLDNNTLVGLGPVTGSNPYGSIPAQAPPGQTSRADFVSSGLPPFVNTTLPMTSALPTGTGIRYQPPNTTPTQTSSTTPSSSIISSVSSQNPRYPVPFNNSTSISQPAGSALPTTQIPPNSAPVYQTVTKEVIPIPLTTTANNSTTQQSNGKFYGNGSSNPIPTVTPDDTGSGSPGETTVAHDNTSLPIPPQTTLPEPIPISSQTPPVPPMTEYLISSPTSSIPDPSAAHISSHPFPIMNTTAAAATPIIPTSTPNNAYGQPPDPSSFNQTTTPTCTSTPHSTLLTVNVSFLLLFLINKTQKTHPKTDPTQFKTFPSSSSSPSLPTPHLSLLYTGFHLDLDTENHHLSSPPTEKLKSISIAPPALSFNLSSVSLGCISSSSEPPKQQACQIRLLGQSAMTRAADGAARAGVMNGVFDVGNEVDDKGVEKRVDGDTAFTKLDG